MSFKHAPDSGVPGWRKEYRRKAGSPFSRWLAELRSHTRTSKPCRAAARTVGPQFCAEGAEVADRRVLIVEDVITTGGQAATSASRLRQLGATIDTVLCVVDRSGGDHGRLDDLTIAVRGLSSSDGLG